MKMRKLSFIALAALMTLTITSSVASARVINLKPSLGQALEHTIKAVTPSRFRRHVTTNHLTFNTNNAQIRGRVTLQYGQWQKIPGVRNPFGGWIRRPSTIKLWSARLVVHWTTHYANAALTDVKVDVGNIRGAVNTRSVRRTVGNWLGRQAGYLRRYVNSSPTVNRRTKTVYIYNQTGRSVEYYIQRSGQWKKFTLGPNRRFRHWSKAHNPNFKINFDRLPGRGVSRKQYNLGYNRSYVFKRRSRSDIDLFARR